MKQSLFPKALLEQTTPMLSAEPKLAVEYPKSYPIENKEIMIHTLVLFGGVFLFLLIAIIAIALKKKSDRVGNLPIFIKIGQMVAYTTSIILPSLLISLVFTCIFAFIGWSLGRYMFISKVFAFVGAICGFTFGLYYFTVIDKPFSWKEDLLKIFRKKHS